MTSGLVKSGKEKGVSGFVASEWPSLSVHAFMQNSKICYKLIVLYTTQVTRLRRKTCAGGDLVVGCWSLVATYYTGARF